jgi:hypothetical protein
VNSKTEALDSFWGPHLTIVESKIIAPDSSHWGTWLDAMSARDVDRRQRACSLHRRLLDQGRIPLLTWHHLEELLGHEDGAKCKARVAHLQDLPLVAFLRLDKDKIGLGSIVQVLAAEAIAASEGHRDLISIRDRARELLEDGIRDASDRRRVLGVGGHPAGAPIA